ncbi:MAG: DUF61 family protein [Ignisphaera sp.]|jgi:uncharacterized protein (UPF0216 family)|nr:DUF61 family protein [Ignisphaera sp.]
MSIGDAEKIEKLLEFELRIVNKHLPLRRLTLRELLDMNPPHVILRDGTIHIFKKSELAKLRQYVNDEELEKLLLPIIVILRPDLGEGVGYVEDPVAAKIIARLLDMEYVGNSRLALYKPHIAVLRRHFDTVFQFAMAIDTTSSFEEHAHHAIPKEMP